jgi:hypothetical protein
MSEEALDLRIHSRREEDTDEEPLDLSDTSEIGFSPVVKIDEDYQADGDLVIVETAVCSMEMDPLHIGPEEKAEILLQLQESMTNSNAQQKQTRSGRSTSKHYPAVDRIISKFNICRILIMLQYLL